MFLFVALVVFSPSKASADDAPGHFDVIHHDYSESQQEYGAVVAEFNRNLCPSVAVSKNRQGEDQQAGNSDFVSVLCRTDGRNIPFEAWNPNYVIAGPSNCFTLYFRKGTDAAAAVEALNCMDGVLYAEFDAFVTACSAENSFHSWGAERLGFACYVPYASAWGGGESTVAVIDSGVYLHPELVGRIQESGFDYIDGDWDATNDLFGHGTGVAGVVADCTAGNAVWLYPIRVLNESGGGSMSNVVNAVREAAQKGVDVINLSIESSSQSDALDQAILDAVSSGVTVVVAAGNKSRDTAQISPARNRAVGVIVVGSVDSDGSRSSYSNYGESIDLYTYGTRIVCCSRSGGYAAQTGTSLAAPHISALAALLRLIHPGLSPYEIEQRIVCSTAESNELNVPQLQTMIPQRMGFQLSLLRLNPAEPFPLPQNALPSTSQEHIQYKSSDETVLVIEDGSLIPLREGAVTVTAACTGLSTCSFSASVELSSGKTVLIPDGVKSIEDEAFWGNEEIQYVVLPNGLETIGNRVFENCPALRVLDLPDTVSSIGENSFSGAVLLCAEGSFADQLAQERGLFYVIQSG